MNAYILTVPLKDYNELKAQAQIAKRVCSLLERTENLNRFFVDGELCGAVGSADHDTRILLGKILSIVGDP